MDVSAFCASLILALTIFGRTESAEYKLVWSDEFNGSAVNEEDWKFDMDCLGN